MKITDWHIMKNEKGEHHIYYFGLEDFDMTEFEEEFGIPYNEKNEIPFVEWTSEDITLVLEAMMEDYNMHRYLYWPRLVLGALQASNIEESEKQTIMRNVLNEMLVFHLN